jgi:hypothetical protein
LNRQPELVVHFFKQGTCLLCLFLAISLSLIACSDKITDSQFSYELSQQAFQSELVSPLALQTQGDNVKFAIAFKGGGGSYDAARLERAKDRVRVILFDTDGKLQNMWVIYQLSGSISGLEPGKYTFQIVNEDGRLVDEDSFTIQ